MLTQAELDVYTHYIPKIAKALERIADALEEANKPQKTNLIPDLSNLLQFHPNTQEETNE